MQNGDHSLSHEVLVDPEMNMLICICHCNLEDQIPCPVAELQYELRSMALHFEMRSDETAGSLTWNGGAAGRVPTPNFSDKFCGWMRVLRSLMSLEAFARVGPGTLESLANAEMPALLQDRARGYS